MCKYTRDPQTLHILTECGLDIIDDELEMVPLFIVCPFCTKLVDLVLEDDSDLAMAQECLDDHDRELAIRKNNGKA